tara:strand:+ start:536 stop:907 length:372 start_codon:yes stop_codon:yes gene_type:complete
MSQSLKNKFESNGSRLGYPNNPVEPVRQLSGPSAEDMASTLHDLYSYDGNPIAPTPTYSNTGKPNRYPGTIAPTQLQAFTGPQNNLAAGAGFRTYNNRETYDSFILGQGVEDRLTGRGDTFLR